MDEDEKTELEGRSLEQSMQFDTFGFTAADLARKEADKEQQQRADMDSAPSEKVRKVEEIIDKRLKPSLERAIAKRNEVFEQQKIFSDLKRNIENLEKNTVTSMKTLVNIGSELYTEADAPNTQHIFVDVGLGLYVEFTWSEALKYIATREEKLSGEIESCTRLIASIKALIKQFLELIREELQLPVREPENNIYY